MTSKPMIKIEKYDLNKSTNEYGVLCQRRYPLESKEFESPFGGMFATVAPLATSQPHDHHEVESFIIFKGKGVMKVGNEESIVQEGDVVYIPAFTEHSLTNLSETDELIFYTIWWENDSSQQQSINKERYLITATPPTPNGDLHLGHLSGPFTGADILKRYLKAKGSEVFYITGADDHQSYVPFKGEQQNHSPRNVADYFGEEIYQTLKMANIQPDLFVKPNESLNHVQYVQNFFLDLYKRGLLIEKEVEAYYCEPCEKFLYEAHIKGICPHCHNDSDGNACEKCGQPNQCIDLGDAHCKSCSHTPSKRKIKQLFFPLSQYAEQLAAYYQELHSGAHLRALFQTMLNEGLPDIPVTHVSDWGIQVPVEGYENQTIYVWFEMAPGYLSATHDLIEENKLSIQFDQVWKDSSTQIINFFGFDNGYFHSVLFPALYMAYDETLQLPKTMITNEFYNLEGLKFSTSRNHAVWGKELLQEYDADVVRYYLSLTRPEIEQTNFVMEDFKKTIDSELATKWNSWLQKATSLSDDVLQDVSLDSNALTTHQFLFLNQIKTSYEMICSAHEPSTFSPQRATKGLNDLVEEAARFSRLESDHSYATYTPLQKTHTKLLELLAAKVLSVTSYPIMPEFAQKLWTGLGYTGDVSIVEALDLTTITLKVDSTDISYFSNLAELPIS